MAEAQLGPDGEAPGDFGRCSFLAVDWPTSPTRLYRPWKMKAAPVAIRPKPTRWFQPRGSFR
jgi:hypothetical protein